MDAVGRYLQWRAAWRESLLQDKQRYMRFHVRVAGLAFGAIFSIALVASDDLANHPTWEKLLIVLGGTFIGGPLWGWCVGQGTWYFRQHVTEPMRDASPRIDELERRVRRLESERDDRHS